MALMTDFNGKHICFTAFSPEETSEQKAFYAWLKKHFQPASVRTLYWGGEAVAKAIPDDIEKIEIAGNNQFSSDVFSGVDVIVRHTTTRPDLLPKEIVITTPTQEFFNHCQAKIVGVTGTKGKGTTASLINEILHSSGIKSRFVGNIGRPAIGVIDDISREEVVIFELSSIQLWDLKNSPHIAVMLMFAEDHLDYHKNYEEYYEAKASITIYQTEDDILIYHPTNSVVQAIASRSKAKKFRYLTKEAAYIENDTIMIDGKELLPVSEVKLIGPHNLENICAAISTAWQVTQDVAKISQAVRDFQGLDHHLQKVGEVNGATYINDSTGTTPDAAIAAIKSFQAPKVLILGGSSKGASYDKLAKTIVESAIRAVVVIGKEKEAIRKALVSAGFKGVVSDGKETMNDIVRQASEQAEANDVVVLSPACASFDMFHSYKDRGEQFVNAVKNL